MKKQQTKFKFTGNIINGDWVKSGSLTSSELLLYADIINWNLRDKHLGLPYEYNLKNDDIMERLNITINTLDTAFRVLEQLDLIKRYSKGDNRTIIANDFNTKKPVLI